MSAEQFANNAQSTLTAGISAGATALSVTSATAFPSVPQFRILVDSELMLVTAVGASWTVQRAIEGTTATAHAAGAVVTNILTAAVLTALGTLIITHAMVDADLTVTETQGNVYIGCGIAFASVDRTLNLPVPAMPMQVTWGDEVTSLGGALANHNLIVNGGVKNVQLGTTSTATQTISRSTLSAGSTFTMLYNGTFWKILG